VLAALSRADDAYQDLVDAVGILRELEATSTAQGESEAETAPLDHGALLPLAPQPQLGEAVTPPASGGSHEVHGKSGVSAPRPRLRRALLTTTPFLIAAGLVLVAVLRRETGDAGVVAVLDDMPPHKPGQLVRAEWETTRGAGDDARPDVVAFRMGAMYADLELAFKANDSSSIRLAASRLAALASSLSASGDIVVQATALQQGGKSAGLASPDERKRFAGDLRSLVDAPVWFDVGLWTEAARQAARDGNTDFFADHGREMRLLDRTLGGLDTLARNDPRAAAAAGWLRQLRGAAALRTIDLPSLAAALDSFSYVRLDLANVRPLDGRLNVTVPPRVP
jgi:hypothetical protein